MATLIVPSLDEDEWPSLGGQVADWYEANLGYGPGELQGEPYVCEPEFRGELIRSYQVYPKGHKFEGRRRFNRVAWNKRKGTAKSEKGAIVAIGELHPDAPVRFDGWDASGNPVGVGVKSPYVGMIAYEKGQLEELAWNVLRIILESSEIAGDFDIGQDRILLLDHLGREVGRAVPLAGAPNARDGARSTFYHFDETHRMTSERLISAHQTMMANNFKRRSANSWTLETTTMFSPSEVSVAANTHAYAESVASGKTKDSRLFYFYRYAPREMPMETPKQVRVAVVEASGPAVEWSADIDGLVESWFAPDTNQDYYRRVWLNQLWAGAGAAFDSARWAELVDASHVVPDRARIALGFDGAKTRDGTALTAVEIETGFAWMPGYWQAPPEVDNDPNFHWEIDPRAVTSVVDYMFDRFRVERFLMDPAWWSNEQDLWSRRHDPAGKIIASVSSRSRIRVAEAVMGLAEAIKAGYISHDGDPILAAHIRQAIRRDLRERSEDDQPLWDIAKDRHNSPRKIDAGMSLAFAWQGRGMAMSKSVDRSSYAVW